MDASVLRLPGLVWRIIYPILPAPKHLGPRSYAMHVFDAFDIAAERQVLSLGWRQLLQGRGVAPSIRVQFPLGQGTKPLLSAPGKVREPT